MSEFIIDDTPLAGLKVITRSRVADDRGYLERVFSSDDLRALMLEKSIAQINHTLTHVRGTIRGLHFQYPPHAETKFVMCLRGQIFDVAVDIRRSSPTFLQWHGEVLSRDNQKMAVVPEGFAHGFQTLDDDVELLYLHTGEYRAHAEGALNALDPVLDIRWPLEVSLRSARDTTLVMLTPDFKGLVV